MDFVLNSAERPNIPRRRGSQGMKNVRLGKIHDRISDLSEGVRGHSQAWYLDSFGMQQGGIVCYALA